MAKNPGKVAGVSRTFNAPRELVWQVWTNAEHLMQWFGPKGATMLKSTFDLRVGGMMHCHMEVAPGFQLWARWVFTEVAPPELLAFINSLSDEKGGITRHPMARDWPPEVLTTVRFTADGSRTHVSLEFVPVNATAAEIKAFEETSSSMEQGWMGTLEKLEDYLKGKRL